MLRNYTELYLSAYTLILVDIWICMGFNSAANAQLVPDLTLSSPSVVNQIDTIYEIKDGSISGNNLFHSFETFSISEGSTAFFNNSLFIDRIITRVTGGDRSIIDGLIQTNGSADLFFINPSGITFGPNSTLDIGGSFITSTADQLEFADGSVFSAVNPSETPLLTITTPVGLQYGSSPGDIIVSGSGHSLGFDAETFVVDRSQRPRGLQVADGEALILTGAGVEIQGGNLTATDGSIHVGSVGASTDLSLLETTTGWTINYKEATQFQDLRLSDAASIDVSGSNSGSVQLHGDHIRLTNGSAVLANVQGSGNGRQSIVNARERLVVTGFSTTDDASIVPSSIMSGVEPNATGTGGNLDIHTPILRILNGGVITTNNLGTGPAGTLTIRAANHVDVDGGIPDLELSGGLLADVYAEGEGGDILLTTDDLSISGGGEVSTTTFANGNAGKLSITADTIQVISGAPILGSSAILASVQEDASGNAGDLTIETNTLTVLDGAAIVTSVFGSGKGGNIIISAQTIALAGASPSGNTVTSIFTDAAEGLGTGGNIDIDTQSLTISGGASISSSTFSEGNAGDLTIAAQTIDLSGRSLDGSNASGIFAAAEEGSGSGGDLFISADNLKITEGAELSVTTFSAGNGGDLNIQAQEIELVGTDATSTGIFASVGPGATGNGGTLTIQTQSLEVLDTAQIAAGTRGAGDAGLLVVDAQYLRLSGADASGASGLFASAVEGRGAGGDIQIRGKQLIVEDGATISASNFFSNNSLEGAGQGPAGDINIDVRDIRVSSQGTITASTSTGGNGNVTILADQFFLTNNSAVTTNAQGEEPGGNIGIDTGLLVGLGNSDITANAEDSFGGRIIINSEQLYGLVFRERLTPGNDVTATSELGTEFNGVVQINNPDIEIAPGTLPETIIVEEKQLAVTCEPSVGDRLVVAGRGGLPTVPFNVMDGQTLWQDWRLPGDMVTTNLFSQRSSVNSHSPEQMSFGPNSTFEYFEYIDMDRQEPATYFEEAQQLAQTTSGEIILTGYAMVPARSTIYNPACFN
ncbi:MAG: filamentous hemagglutinin N-terminal domain-containing protein [Cyanobacteria bacterium P01_F01_bin.150]